MTLPTAMAARLVSSPIVCFSSGPWFGNGGFVFQSVRSFGHETVVQGLVGFCWTRRPERAFPCVRRRLFFLRANSDDASAISWASGSGGAGPRSRGGATGSGGRNPGKTQRTPASSVRSVSKAAASPMSPSAEGSSGPFRMMSMCVTLPRFFVSSPGQSPQSTRRFFARVMAT